MTPTDAHTTLPHDWKLSMQSTGTTPNPFAPAPIPTSFPALKRDTLHVTADMLKDQPLTIPSPSTHCFRLYGDPILTLRANGIVEIAKDYTPSEAGAAFLAYVREHWPKEEHCRRIRELEERIKKLEDAGDKLCGQIGCGCATAIDGLCEYCKQASDEWHQFTETKP